jgi:hypothetical protein
MFVSIAYAYLLGMYLGDGHVTAHGRNKTTARLVISLDAVYPEIVDECRAACEAVYPEASIQARAHRADRNVVLVSYGRRWLDYFPQHGPGAKHERRIVLARWQRAILDERPEPFLRGLIHSDGCRCINRFTTKLPSGRLAEYAYPRYFFSNLSDDIRRLFCDYCGRLGIRWTQSSHRNISVADRRSVELLDAFVGSKA